MTALPPQPGDPAVPAGPEPAAWDEVLALRRAGRPAEALAALARLLAELPAARGHAQTRSLRALLLADQAAARERAADPAGAAELLERALEDAPHYPDLHHRLGVVRLRLGDRRGARRAFDEALRRAPAYAAPRLELALLEARDGRLGESLELLRRLGEQNRARAGEEFERGLKRIAEADWEGGGVSLRRALGLDGAPVDARLERVGASLAAGDIAGAIVLARNLVADHPYFPDAQVALALARRAAGAWDDCAESCGRALELNPDFHQARVYLAEALSRRGQWAEADHQLGLVLAAEPAHPLALSLARSLRRGFLPASADPLPH